MNSTTQIVPFFLSLKVKRLKQPRADTAGILPSFLCMFPIVFMCPPQPPPQTLNFFSFQHPDLQFSFGACSLATGQPLCRNVQTAWRAGKLLPSSRCRILKAQLSDCLRLEQILRCNLPFWVPAGSGWSHFCRTFPDPVSSLFLLPPLLSPLP